MRLVQILPNWLPPSPREARYAAARIALVAAVGGIMASFFAVYTFWHLPPPDFPTGATVAIAAGDSMDTIAHLLYGQKVIASPLLFKGYVILQRGATSLQAGEYFFPEPESAWQIAARLITGDTRLTPIRVTIPEGATTYQMAEILAKKFSRFDAVSFAEKARPREGYLYPDTYFFPPNATIEEILAVMEQNFFTKIASIQDKIDAFGRPLHEVVTMASLLEREARTYEARRMIAGILWKRLDLGMPLQVDAVFGYIYRRETFSPRLSQLEADSPYNTYRNKGLPPGPIASPSLSSLEAAVDPLPSDYLFYLTGRDGKMYYSATYREHLQKKRRYLD